MQHSKKKRMEKVQENLRDMQNTKKLNNGYLETQKYRREISVEENI